MPADQVFQSVRAILDLLFWPAGADVYEVQHPFWTEPLGKMLSQAKWRSIDRAELMSIGAAAEQLGVTRPTIYRWMYAGTSNPCETTRATASMSCGGISAISLRKRPAPSRSSASHCARRPSRRCCANSVAAPSSSAFSFPVLRTAPYSFHSNVEGVRGCWGSNAVPSLRWRGAPHVECRACLQRPSRCSLHRDGEGAGARFPTAANRSSDSWTSSQFGVARASPSAHLILR